MNSVRGKIVYECVSQRDLSVIWPDDPPNRPAYQTSQLSLSPSGTPQHSIGFVDNKKNLQGIPWLTSLVTCWLKNPRYYRWFLTLVISLIFACVLGFFNSFGTLYMCLRRDLQSSATETGWVASLAWSFCLLSPLITALYQRLGPRLISSLGIILCFIGLFASTFAQNIWTLYLTFGVMFGVGVNLLFVSSINLITSYFDSHECAMPTVLPGVGATAGMLVFCPVLEIVFNRFGWRMSLRVIASIILVTGLAGCLLFRLPPTPEKVDKEELEKLQLKAFRLKEIKEKAKKSKDNYKLLLKDPMHWVFGIGTLISSMTLLCSVINLVEFISLAGYSDERSAFFMSILGFVDTGGRLVTAFIGDRLPCSRILVIPVVCLLMGAVTFMLTITTQTAAIITYVVVVGISRAIIYSIMYATSVETFGHALHQESFAIMLLMTGVGSLMAPLIPGLSFDLTGSYTMSNYCFSILWLVSCAKFLAVYFMKNYRNKRMFESKRVKVEEEIEETHPHEKHTDHVDESDDVEEALEPLTVETTEPLPRLDNPSDHIRVQVPDVILQNVLIHKISSV